MKLLPARHHWSAEALKLRRQRSTWLTAIALWLVLLATSLSAGLSARAWRADSVAHLAAISTHLQTAQADETRAVIHDASSLALMAYRLGRSELGRTRMPVTAGLALGVARLEVLPSRLKVSLDSRTMDSPGASALRNPLLVEAGQPGVPAMVALLVPLALLVLCGGLVQEEREQRRLALVRVQSRDGLMPVVVAALGWRLALILTAAASATLPALMLDPGSDLRVMGWWFGMLAAFCLFWTTVCGLLSLWPGSTASSLLIGLAVWLTLTFATPTALALFAQSRDPLPSRLQAVVHLREAQQHAEDAEERLVEEWFASHPDAAPRLPGTWPATFVVRSIEEDRLLRPFARRFDEIRARQAAFIDRWSWTSPALVLILAGHEKAGTDLASHLVYQRHVDHFEDRWREAIAPHVLSGTRLPSALLAELTAYASSGWTKR